MEAKVREYNVKGRLVHIEKMRNLILDALGDKFFNYCRVI